MGRGEGYKRWTSRKKLKQGKERKSDEPGDGSDSDVDAPTHFFPRNRTDRYPAVRDVCLLRACNLRTDVVLLPECSRRFHEAAGVTTKRMRPTANGLSVASGAL